MLGKLGLNRDFLVNPVTWIALALFTIASAQVVRADRNFSRTCALTAPIHAGVINIPEYYVQPSDTVAYEACKGRIPDRWKNHWPLAHCEPGGMARFSDGRLAFFPQKCRASTGNLWVY